MVSAKQLSTISPRLKTIPSPNCSDLSYQTIRCISPLSVRSGKVHPLFVQSFTVCLTHSKELQKNLFLMSERALIKHQQPGNSNVYCCILPMSRRSNKSLAFNRKLKPRTSAGGCKQICCFLESLWVSRVIIHGGSHIQNLGDAKTKVWNRPWNAPLSAKHKNRRASFGIYQLSQHIKVKTICRFIKFLSWKRKQKAHPLRSHLSDYDAFQLDVGGIKLMHATEAFNQRVGRLIGALTKKKKNPAEINEFIPLRSLDTDPVVRRRHPTGVWLAIIPGACTVVNTS